MPVGSPRRCATFRTSTPANPKRQVVTREVAAVLLYVGRLERLKGVQVLIDVFRDYQQADLLIVGEGTMGAELRGQAEGLDHVRFLGRLHPSQLGQLYDGAVALVVPSIGYEVFGIVALEAFARRTPAIAHDLGALTEVIEDSGGGLLYRTTAELRAAMDRLLGDDELRTQLGNKGYDAWQRLWSEDVHVTGITPRSRRPGGSVDDGGHPHVPRGRERSEAVMHRAGAVRRARRCDRRIRRKVPDGARARHGSSRRRVAGAGRRDHVRRRL